MKRMYIVAQEPDIEALRAELEHPGCGGFCVFEGRVRDSNAGAPVEGLAYEAYAELAESEGERIIDEARVRFAIVDARCAHRIGSLQVGALAIWIGVAAAHRDAAFQACRYIIDEAKRRLPVWKKEQYQDRPPEWVIPADDAIDGSATEGTGARQAGVGTPTGGRTAKTFAPDYSRQTRLPGFGAAGQRRLAQSRVLVIGAGGLGASALSYLAGAGVGRIGIVDGDRLEASNLHRQVIYSAADIGSWKVDLAARRLHELNPAVEIETIRGTLDAATAEAAFRRYDLVLECTDDAASKYLSNDAAIATRTPIVFASVYQFEGQLHAWVPESRTACLRCLWPVPPASDVFGTCAGGGVLGPVPGVLGALQAIEAIKRLVGLPGAIEDRLLLVNLLDYGLREIGTSRSGPCLAAGRCVSHASTPPVTVGNAIPAAIASTRLASPVHASDVAGDFSPAVLERNFAGVEALRASGLTVVDIRNGWEIAQAPFPVDVTALPMPVLLADDAVRQLAASAPIAAAGYLIVCAHGQRSLHVTRHLRMHGLEPVWSLAGGLAALEQT